MSTIDYILKKEHDRLKQLHEKIEQERSELPKGSLSKKRRGNNFYYYLAYRDDDKVKFTYIGPEGNNIVEQITQKIEKRKMLDKKLHEIREAICELERKIRK